MKKFFAFALLAALVTVTAGPASATIGTTGDEQVKNLQTGSQNVAFASGDYMAGVAGEAAKGTNTGERLTGVAAGTFVGARAGIHRLGAGAIDLLTFWIPKKEPLISPEEAPHQ